MAHSYSSSGLPGAQTPAVLCLAHLGWDYIWQRPQHLLSRIATHVPVAYVNEPDIVPPHVLGPPHLELVSERGGLSAWQPHFPGRADVLERWRDTYTRLVQDLLLRLGWATCRDGFLEATRPLILWFYTPVPFYMLDRLPASLVVYDVMDELAAFRNAATDLLSRETHLLARADLVFAGGRSLYESRRARHPRVFLYPSGVDPAHFAQALDPSVVPARELATLPAPVLGYYGAIDERVDLALLEQVAAGHPEWSIAMLGPVVKIDPSDLPRRPNLRYFGQQPYDRLPEFLKRFDVCLMPFAMNASTRYISPTKTLEYMAARRPIVSTPVPDVVASWSDVVRVADGAEAFAAAVAAALAETESERTQRHALENAHLARSNWDTIAAEMHAHTDRALARKVRSGPVRMPALVCPPLEADQTVQTRETHVKRE